MPMVAVEVLLTDGPVYVVLQTWDDDSKVRIPMDNGERILTPQDIRTNWDAWVSELFNDEHILTYQELREQHPDVNINSEIDVTADRSTFMDQMGFTE